MQTEASSVSSDAFVPKGYWIGARRYLMGFILFTYSCDDIYILGNLNACLISYILEKSTQRAVPQKSCSSPIFI